MFTDNKQDYKRNGLEEIETSNDELNKSVATPDIRMIACAKQVMTSEQAANLREYAQYMFPEAFER